MRSQLVTLMAPEDEAAFLSFVFARPTVSLITDVRSPTPEIRHTRDVRAIRGLNCMLWDAAILPRPQVEQYWLSVNATEGGAAYVLAGGQVSLG